MTIDDASRLVAAARASDDGARLAEQLVGRADALVLAGRLAEALVDLDEAAALHSAAGRAAEEALCARFAATICRLLGRFDEARRRAERAAKLVGGAAAEVELAEIALAGGRADEAAAAFTRALDLTAAAERAPLLQKRATALAAGGRFREAAADLDQAERLLTAAGDASGALFAQIERATALHHAGDTAAARRLGDAALELARQLGNAAAAADVYLLQAAQAVDRRDVSEALAAARAARQAALDAVAPVQYIAAAVTMAQLAEAQGDQVGAYEALAVGWVTVGDLLGREAARATFEPKLLALRESWGADRFGQVKQIYEAGRRTARAREASGTPSQAPDSTQQQNR